MELDLRFRVRCALGRREGTMADEDYIRQLEAQISARHSEHVQQTERENREAALLKEAAPKEWIKLKDWLRDTITQVNQGNPIPHLTYEDGDHIDESKILYRIGNVRNELRVTLLKMLGYPITVRMGEKLAFEFN